MDKESRKIAFGLYHMGHITWSISHGESNMVHIIWNFALKQWVFELVFAFITKIRIQIFTNFYDFFDLLCFRRYSDEGWKSVWSRVPEIIPLPRLMDRDFIYIQFVKSEESLQVFDWFDYLLEDSIFFCLALSPSVLVGRLRCSIYRCSSCLLVLILEYSWTQCTVFVEIVWGRIRVTQWSRKFDRRLTWAICASCAA